MNQQVYPTQSQRSVMSQICGRISINFAPTSMLQVLKLFILFRIGNLQSALYTNLHPVSLISSMTFGVNLGTTKCPCVAIYNFRLHLVPT